MKYPLLSFAFMSLLSCNQDDNEPEIDLTQMKSALQVHSWIFDSVQVHDPQHPYSFNASEPKPIVDFTDDKWFITYPPSPATDSFYYSLEKPNKLYRWRQGYEKDLNEVIFVHSVTENALVFSYMNDGNEQYDFHHAR